MRGARIPNSPSSPPSQDGCIRDQERLLPIANVSRIMKKTLPANAKISKEAKETVQECVSEFISFVTGEASDKCQREKRKTVNGDDLLWAMTTLGFDDYVVPLKDYLSSYRESEGETREKSEKNERVFRSSSASSPCEVDFDAEKIASNPSFLQGFGSGGGVLIEFGGGRVMAEGGGVEW
ncbi:nuclear transcription factor Y subunit B-1-like [Salvia hispanica]|uniref:nuclear transcription factor Y subunit B-1-like n=1 Tax=Salvia hispanica TaxID=49212 RepID=UPI0020099080|nr:nuclear transcription factor Y subunit B-1-like [Salvia hispanica]